MRSRREEYAKRFEELTKQEIKNYNDSLLNTHVALEEFRRDLKNSIDLYAQQVAHLHSKISSLESQNFEFKEDTKNSARKIERQEHHLNNLEREKIEFEKKTLQFQEWVKKELDIFKLMSMDISVKLENLSHGNVKNVSNLYETIQTFYNKSNRDNEQLKEEILALPSETESLKKELLAKVEAQAIDNKGLIKEVLVVKKKSTIQESLNQYFHIQLDRLKESKST